MTIPEAIEILTKEQKDHHSYPTDIIGKAELLGIEALKRDVHNRLINNHPDQAKLPGETED